MFMSVKKLNKLKACQEGIDNFIDYSCTTVEEAVNVALEERSYVYKSQAFWLLINVLSPSRKRKLKMFIISIHLGCLPEDRRILFENALGDLTKPSAWIVAHRNLRVRVERCNDYREDAIKDAVLYHYSEYISNNSLTEKEYKAVLTYGLDLLKEQEIKRCLTSNTR